MLQRPLEILTVRTWLAGLLAGLVLLVIGPALQVHAQERTIAGPQTLKILTKRIEPFVSYKDRKFSGFSIDLWQLIAERQGWKYEFKLEPTLAALLFDMKEGRADAAIAAVTITAEREQYIDFSHPYFRSGLAILTASESASATSQVLGVLLSMFLSKTFAWAGIILLVTLLIASHIIWLLERRNNPQFAKSYIPGLWDSFWWALVTITTVGYGDKAPKAIFGRLFAMFWMIVGYFMFAYFTASVTSSVTVRELRGAINGPGDLGGHKVAVIEKSTSAKYMRQFAAGATLINVDRIEQAYHMLDNGTIEAIVHDAPVLLYHAAQQGPGRTRIAGPVFHEEDYGIVLPEGSKLREPVSRAILRLMENGDYARLYAKWFGTE